MKKAFLLPGLIGGILFFPFSGTLFAQTGNDSTVSELTQQVNSLKLGENHFMVAGLLTFGFVSSSTTTNGVKQVPSSTNTFDADHFEWSPMLLWRHGKNLLLEFEPSFDGNEIGVNWACASYFVTNGLIVRGGLFVLPFGIYNKRLAAGWIDKLATDPSVADYPPGSDWGVEAEGGLQLGPMKGTYDVALTTGFQLLHDGAQDGALQNPNGSGLTDNNNNKTLCGRLSLLPFSNSSLEIGVSGLIGKVGDTNDSLYKDAMTSMYAIDLDYVKDINPFLLNIKGQYNFINVDKEAYPDPTDFANTYSFTNHTSSYFGQVSLRPTAIHNKIVRNFELAFRYANFMAPKGSLWEQNSNATTVGLDYWLSWRSVVKITYESVNSDFASLGIAGDKTKTSNLFLQYSVQF